MDLWTPKWRREPQWTALMPPIGSTWGLGLLFRKLICIHQAIVQPCFSKPPSPGEKPGSQAHSQPISILPFYITIILPHTSPCRVCAFFVCVFGLHFLVAHMFPCHFLVLARPCHTFPVNHCSCILRMLRPHAASLAID